MHNLASLVSVSALFCFSFPSKMMVMGFVDEAVENFGPLNGPRISVGVSCCYQPCCREPSQLALPSPNSRLLHLNQKPHQASIKKKQLFYKLDFFLAFFFPFPSPFTNTILQTVQPWRGRRRYWSIIITSCHTDAVSVISCYFPYGNLLIS